MFDSFVEEIGSFEVKEGLFVGVKPMTMFLFGVALLTSCGPQIEKTREEVDSDSLVAYKAAACQYKPDEGEKASPVEPALDLRTTFFDKKYNQALLTSVLRTSMIETVRFEEAHSVRVYRTDRTVGGCTPFDFLDVAPTDFARFWARADAPLSSKSFLAGLYIDKSHPDIASAQVTAEIGVRRDANRWTVVHEFMHHLFETEAARATGMSGSRLQDQLKSAVDRLIAVQDRVDAAVTTENVAALIDTYDEVYSLVRQVTLRYPLEEVTIETTLQEMHRAGELRFAPFNQASSDRYIAKSAGLALKRIADLQEVAQAIEHTAERVSPLPANLSKLGVAIANQNALRTEVVSVYRRSHSLAAQPALTLQSRVVSAPRPRPGFGSDDAECAHTAGFDRSFKRLDQLLDRLHPLNSLPPGFHNE